MIGDTEAIGHCVKSAVTDTRKSYLSKRLKLAFDAQVNKKVALAMLVKSRTVQNYD
ncbi:MAG: hypothetical protein IJ356_08055 [Erysipelotrichaceae bacterium]|nr:hypothetical protein [Erysipelotrichaceae bacterium]